MPLPFAHYHRGRELGSFEQTARRVVAHFSNGSVSEGDVLIGADGLRSTVRQPCLPAIAPLYAGYVAWRAMLPEDALPPAIHRDLFDAMTFSLPPGEQFLGYPVAGPDNDLRPGGRRYNVVWYRPADAATELRWLLTDECGVLHADARFRRRSSGATRSRPCAQRRNSCWRRNAARSCG